jgi:hypothetical protein
MNLCGTGTVVSKPPNNICTYFSCIKNFWKGTGTMEECKDGSYSLSGGLRGACSYHRGELKQVYRG